MVLLPLLLLLLLLLLVLLLLQLPDSLWLSDKGDVSQLEYDGQVRLLLFEDPCCWPAAEVDVPAELVLCLE